MKETGKKIIISAEKQAIEIFWEIEVKNNKLQLDEQLNGLEFFLSKKLEKIIAMYIVAISIVLCVCVFFSVGFSCVHRRRFTEIEVEKKIGCTE